MEINETFATRLYETAQRLGTEAPDESGGPGGESFAATMARAAEELTATLHQGEQAATRAVSGVGDVQSVVEALTAAELALETAVTVRDKVVEAYQDILRMPV